MDLSFSPCSSRTCQTVPLEWSLNYVFRFVLLERSWVYVYKYIHIFRLVPQDPFRHVPKFSHLLSFIIYYMLQGPPRLYQSRKCRELWYYPRRLIPQERPSCPHPPHDRDSGSFKKICNCSYLKLIFEELFSPQACEGKIDARRANDQIGRTDKVICRGRFAPKKCHLPVNNTLNFLLVVSGHRTKFITDVALGFYHRTITT